MINQIHHPDKISAQKVVIYVDDDEICRHSISLLFQINFPDYVLILVSTVEEAINALNKNTKNAVVVIADLSLGGKSGIELIKYIIDNNIFKHIQILILSGRSLRTEEKEIIRGRDIIELKKPCDHQIFLSTLKASMEKAILLWLSTFKVSNKLHSLSRINNLNKFKSAGRTR